MRTYGRLFDEFGDKTWVQVNPDAAGFLDSIYLTTLIQCLKLNLGESPFHADYGIPAHPSVVQQIFPDFYVARTQQQFAPYFANLTITKQPSRTPTYLVNVLLHNGASQSVTVRPGAPLLDSNFQIITDRDQQPITSSDVSGRFIAT